MYDLELIEANPYGGYGNPKATRAMRKASKYRKQGYPPDVALSMGWEEVKNPIPRKAKEGVTFAPNLLFVGALGYLAWCGIRYAQDKVWSWQPWRSNQIKRRLVAEAERITKEGG